MLKTKKSKLLIVVLLSISMSAVFLLSLISFLIKTFSPPSADPPLTISIYSQGDFTSFCNRISSASSLSGYKVTLYADIDFGGAELSCGGGTIKTGSGATTAKFKAFAGTFNGNGHTLSNFKMTTHLEAVHGKTQPDSSVATTKNNFYGLFTLNGGVVCNTKFSNVQADCPNWGAYTNGIICYGGTIHSCIIESLTYTESKLGTSYSFAFGGSTTTVEDCMLENRSVSDEIESFNFAGGTITRCISKVSGLNATYNSTDGSYSNLGNGLNLAGPYGATSNGTKVDNRWYFQSGWTWPYLRTWLSFQNFQFDKNGDGTLDVTDRYVVSYNVANYANSFVNSTSTTLALPNGTVSASSAPAGKHFTKWTKSGYNFYANYANDVYTLNFSTVSSVNPSTASKTVTYNNTYKATHSYSASQTRITYNIAGTNITYSFAAKYKVDSYGSINGNSVTTSSKSIPDFEHGKTFTITPTISLKSYNITFN